MNLTKEQQEIYDGKQGATLAKVMQTLVRYGELFGADGMVPVTSKYNHLVTSFGLKALAPVYELMNQLIESGNVSKQKFSADPRPLDPNVPSSFLQDFVFEISYSKQDDYEKQLTQLGIMEKDAYTCTCYMDEVEIPGHGRNCCPGLSLPQWFMPTPYWEQVIVTPVSLTSWEPVVGYVPVWPVDG